MSIYDAAATRLVTNKKVTLDIGDRQPDSVRRGIARAIAALNEVGADLGIEYCTRVVAAPNEDGTCVFTLNEKPKKRDPLTILGDCDGYEDKEL